MSRDEGVYRTVKRRQMLENMCRPFIKLVWLTEIILTNGDSNRIASNFAKMLTFHFTTDYILYNYVTNKKTLNFDLHLTKKLVDMSYILLGLSGASTKV